MTPEHWSHPSVKVWEAGRGLDTHVKAASWLEAFAVVLPRRAINFLPLAAGHESACLPG